MAPLVMAFSLDPSRATAILLSVTTAFVGLYVVRPIRSAPRMATLLRLRPCRRYIPWLTFAAAMKLILMLSTLAIHEQLAAWRILPNLPQDEDVVSADFLAQPGGQVALFLAMAVAAPMIEEFAFRGRVQHTLEHAVGVVPAIVASAVVFAALHGRIDAVHHLAFGLFAGWVVWRTGSIWTAVYMHALNNTAAQLLAHLSSVLPVTWNDVPTRVWPYAIASGLLGLAGLVGAGARIHRLAETVRPGRGGRVRKRSLRMAVSPLA